MNNKKEIVFVYGTLKKGGHFSRALDGQEFLGKAETKENYALYFGAYPFASKFVRGKTSVKGEAYRVSKDALNVLDRVESHPAFYVREKVKVTLEDGKNVSAWMYFLPVDRLNWVGEKTILIKDGNFPIDEKSLRLLIERRDKS